MERRQVFAWAGSITLVAAATALVLGSSVGRFGIRSAPAPQPGATSAGSKPGGPGSGPQPGSPAAQPAPEAGPAPGSGPAVQQDRSSPAAGGKLPVSVPSGTTTSLSGTCVPPRGPVGPATSTGGTRAPAPKLAQLPSRGVPGQQGSGQQGSGQQGSGQQGSGQQGSGQQSVVRTAVKIATSGAWRAQLLASALGQSPGGDPRTVAGTQAGNGRGDDG
jgi:hypothetical protein